MWQRIPRDGIADALATVTAALPPPTSGGSAAPRAVWPGAPLGHPLNPIAWRLQQPCAAADPPAVARPRQARKDPRRGGADLARAQRVLRLHQRPRLPVRATHSTDLKVNGR